MTRQIPSSPEAERGVLGCIILDAATCVPLAIESFKHSDVFFDQRHQLLFDLLIEMYDQKQPIDSVTLYQRLTDANQVNVAGGIQYVASLPNDVPSAANIDHYLNIVREKFLLREMLRVCTQAVAKVYEFKLSEECTVPKLMDAIEKDILSVNESRAQHTTAPIKELVRSAIRTIEDMHQRQGAIGGIPTGFIDFDKMTDGLHPGEFIVFAARPSIGKSSLLMNIVEHVAVDQKLPVGVFSLEMSAESLVLRTICARSRLNLRNIREGFLAERDFPRLTNAAGKMASAPIYIDDTPGLNIMQLRARARRLWQQYGIQLLGVDYMQMLSGTGDTRQNREREVAEISVGLKNLAKELKIPVIGLCQLNREVEKSKGRKPNMSDIRESGSVEQDADLIGLLYKADPENRRRAAEPDDEDSARQQEAIPVNLLIAKQRQGPTGDVHLTFLKSITRFESAAKIGSADVPSE